MLGVKFAAVPHGRHNWLGRLASITTLARLFIGLALAAITVPVSGLPVYFYVSDASQNGGQFQSNYTSWWNSKAGTTRCQACHVGATQTTTLTSYGTHARTFMAGDRASFDAALFQSTAEAVDSDTDGQTNGRELRNSPFTFPGDGTNKGPPAPVADTAPNTNVGQTLVIAKTTLLANDLDTRRDLPGNVISVGNSVGGTASISGNNVTFNATTVGAASFTYTVSDAGGQASATVSFQVAAAANTAPVANADTATASSGSTLTLAAATLLANDTDGEGDTLTITGVTAGTGGTVSLSGTTVTFTPTAGFTGAASFTYTISDGTATASGTVTVTVTAAANRPPVANADAGTGFTTDRATRFTTNSVLANDVDPDGDALSVASVDLAGTRGTVTSGANGTFSYDPNGQFAALSAGQTATDSFGYTIADGRGGTATARVTITIQGITVAPVATADSATTAFATAVTIPVSANDTTGGPVTSIAIGTAPRNGTATVSGLSVVYTPGANFSGQDSFTYVAVNGALRSAPATVTITVQPGFVAGSIRGGTTNPRLLSTASALDDVCVSLNGLTTTTRSSDQATLYATCRGLGNTARASGNIDDALGALTNEESFAASDSSLDIARAIGGNLSTRLDAIGQQGSGGRGVNLAGLNVVMNAPMSMMMQVLGREAVGRGLNQAMGNDANTKWGFFVSGQLQFGKRKAGAASGKRDFNTQAITTGIDYAVTPYLTTGFAVSFSKLGTKFGSDFNKLDVDGLTYTLYLATRIGPAHLDGYVGYSNRNYSSRRNIVFATAGTTTDTIAKADYKGSDTIGGLRAYVPVVDKGLRAEVIGEATYVRTQIDTYREDGAAGYNLDVLRQSDDFLLADIGLRVGYRVENKSGSLTPRIDVRYHYAVGRDDRRIQAGFVSDPLQRHAIALVSASDSDADYFSGLIGLSAQVDRASLGIGYSSIFGLKDVETGQVTVSLTVPF